MSEMSGDELHGKTAQICIDRLYCSGLWWRKLYNASSFVLSPTDGNCGQCKTGGRMHPMARADKLTGWPIRFNGWLANCQSGSIDMDVNTGSASAACRQFLFYCKNYCCLFRLVTWSHLSSWTTILTGYVDCNLCNSLQCVLICLDILSYALIDLSLCKWVNRQPMFVKVAFKERQY
jgi:hypothetical protein